MNFKENYQDILNLCRLSAKGKFVNITAYEMLSELYIELQDSEFDFNLVSSTLKSIIYRDRDKLPLVYVDDISITDNNFYKPIDNVDILSTKKCSKCKKHKEINENFYVYTRNGHAFVNSKCKKCASSKGLSRPTTYPKYKETFKKYREELSVSYVKAKMIYSKKYTKEQLEESPKLILDRIEQIKLKRERRNSKKT